MARTKQTASCLAHDNTTKPTRVLRSHTVKRQRDRCCCRNEYDNCDVQRCTEPLAWNIKDDEVVTQNDCPLFNAIPVELRNLICEYALTDSTWSARSPKGDRALNLLHTCKAVYLETFALPLRLNALQLPFTEWLPREKQRIRLPWQFANIQSLDITLQQVSLEGESLYNFFFGPSGWQPEARHQNVFVAPDIGLKNTPWGSYESCNFTLLSTGISGDRTRLRDALEEMDLPAEFQKPMSDMRLQRARPLVHLTLRMRCTDWWTWSDDPSSTDAKRNHLALDPTVGNGEDNLTSRPTSTQMQALAQQRRDGYDTTSSAPFNIDTPGWGHIISKLPDIKTLELVLETFTEKKAQLDTVVECAKTWRFPIADTQFELAWNGKVKSAHHSRPHETASEQEAWDFGYGQWWTRGTEIEERIIRFTRQRTPPSTDSECNVH
ncbi:hypothetical protein C7974DRAFT_112689 [Boeremia exigua]|uniref:uncharacterized protein n=1 Tax=Boeremia exigua TaxID=749465 RepID=UPI001E8ED982|nr:uncharacterized protein C7974DRAFT_112689 [Boeremia exigua]KAH6642906.1 hypothetical protein C7974DRAFT_112689 [Boeremia exigua]